MTRGSSGLTWVSALGLMPRPPRARTLAIVDRAQDRLPQWLRTPRTDATMAAAFTLAGLAQTAIYPMAGGALGPLYVLGSTLPLAWRRSRPVESALVSSAFWLIPLDGYPVLGYVVVILQFFALGSRGTPRAAVVLATLWACAVSVVGTLLGPEAPVAAIGGALAVAAPVGVGQVVARLRRQNAELARLTEDLRRERLNAEEAAVGAERARIAQELHDVVGHEVTLIAIQAEAAASALRVRPERAAEPVEAIRATAHRTLAEIRSVLDILAPGGRDGRDGREPAREDIAAISRRAEDAGIANTLVVTGDPWPAQSPASLAVGRIVRECLTNAGRHAPGERVSLAVDWTAREVRLEAVNPGAPTRPPTPGRGLSGIRHRADLLGGTFHSRVHDGLFEIRVTLPAASPTSAAGQATQTARPAAREARAAREADPGARGASVAGSPR